MQKKSKQAEDDLEICQILNSKNGGPDTVMKLRGEVSELTRLLAYKTDEFDRLKLVLKKEQADFQKLREQAVIPF